MIMSASMQHVNGYCECLNSIAGERLWISSFEAPPAHIIENFFRRMIGNDAPFFVALDGERVVGWCDIRQEKRAVFRHGGSLGIGILREFRGQGTGTKLMQVAIAKATQKGIIRIELDVFAHNEAAIALYSKMGFVHEGTRVRAAKLDQGYVDVCIMARWDDSFPE